MFAITSVFCLSFFPSLASSAVGSIDFLEDEGLPALIGFNGNFDVVSGGELFGSIQADFEMTFTYETSEGWIDGRSAQLSLDLYSQELGIDIDFERAYQFPESLEKDWIWGQPNGADYTSWYMTYEHFDFDAGFGTESNWLNIVVSQDYFSDGLTLHFFGVLGPNGSGYSFVPTDDLEVYARTIPAPGILFLLGFAARNRRTMRIN